ncbi:MAG: ATP-binding cassette subfamily F protein 3 [Motiliproteus sp.]|jgi:ATP-binding cassette subfamily F protein 3
MIELIQLSLQRGKNQLLNQVDLRLHDGYRVGLIGANGSGKSSLFKMLLGTLEADAGDLRLPRQWRIAHMAQESHTLERLAVDYVLDGDSELRQVQQELADAELQVDATHVGELHARLAGIDGYTADARARQLLNGLGFKQSEIDRPVANFSGGWRIRLNLAQALMSRSDLLLLDEPTNHLDLDATLWLEQWLKTHEGTLILISHDRDFLDRVVGHIVHLDKCKLTLYKGNYSDFEQLRAEKLSHQQAAFEKQQIRIGEIEAFVNRFKAQATKAKQAQSRIKELERMERIAPAHVDSPFSFSFKCTQKMSTPLLVLDKAVMGYAGTPIINQTTLHLMPEMRIGLLGANGAGKSTLIKTLMADIELLAGERRPGENLRIGYFAQHQLEALDLEASPLLHLQRLAPQTSEQRIRDYLGGFGFRGDGCIDPVKLFSGGEKARLALALIAWQEPNLLLMDEPTNHLDLEVRHALTMALQTFPGALILVSHDRHLLRNCVDDFLLVSDGKVTPFDGDLNDYARWLTESAGNKIDIDEPVSSEPAGGESSQERKERKRLEAARRQQLAPLRKRVEKLEQQLEQQASDLDQINEQLADASLYEEGNKLALRQLLQQQATLQQLSGDTEEQWLAHVEELELLSEEVVEE